MYCFIALNLPEILDDVGEIKEKGLSIAAICTGYYKGEKENSYKIPITCGRDIWRLVSLGKEHKQESILYIDNQSRAYLYYLDSQKTEYIGIYTEISEQLAQSLGAYTIEGGRHHAAI